VETPWTFGGGVASRQATISATRVLLERGDELARIELALVAGAARVSA